jgi:tetratricopeptide (TPR) repeat protein
MAKKIIPLLVVVPLLCLLTLAPARVQAEVQTIVSTIRQPFDGSQSAEEARVVATAKARQEVLEKAEKHIEKLTVVQNQTVAKNEIPALTAGILETEIASQKNYAADNAFVFEVTARIKVNTAILEAQAARLLKDKDLFRKYQAVRKKESDLLSRIKTLEAETRKHQKSPSDEKKDLGQKLQRTISALSAAAWYNKALDLANHQTFTGKIPEEAIRYLETAVKLDPEYGDAFSWLGKMYYDKGEYGRAVEYGQKGLAIDLKTKGANHPDLITAYNRLGLAFHRQGEYDRAIEAYRNAWKIQIQTVGESHPDVATTYNNLGETYRRKGAYDRAIEYYLKDLEISLKALGRNHPNVATSYNNLGYAYHGKGQDDRAMEYFQKALEVYRTALGENHPQTQAVMENIEFLKTNVQ